jgi:glucose-1-phosphate thymidylyltransferase
MNIIIPMAGMGKRMRPHTLTIPKPLIPIAGKPIVQRLVEDIAKVCGKPIQEIAFIIGRFGPEVEAHLIQVASEVGAKGRIFYQDEALGTAHAVQCAKECLNGEVVVAFADTLFKADFTIDTSKDGVIFVQQVADPTAFGVVTIGADGHIEGFVEKPKSFVSDLAIIGIYYFKDGDYLKNEIQYLLDHNIRDKGEYQITNALENMKNKGTRFFPGSVSEWLDCGNSDATVYTNTRYLSYLEGQNLMASDVVLEHSVVIQPSYVGKGVKITRSVVGPYASIGDGSQITDSRIKETIVLKNSSIKNSMISGSMVGNHTSVEGKMNKLSLGDYSTLAE